MKNTIAYYYNLTPENIHHQNNIYYFDYQKERFFLTPCHYDINEINEIYKLHIILLNQGIYVHQIILNRNNNPITIINDEPYILLKTKYYQEQITINHILSFSNIILNNSEKNISWSTLWENKNDYLEYQMNELGQKNPILKESFSYYIGLGETAITLVNLTKDLNVNKVISHKRINTNDTMYELYNPLNLIVDSKVRDIAEYFKSSFFNNKNINYELNNYLINSNLNKTEYILFLARMIYPTYYFDLYENIIGNKEKIENIKKITDKTNDFEILIKQIYKFCKTKTNIQIEWLES